MIELRWVTRAKQVADDDGTICCAGFERVLQYRTWVIGLTVDGKMFKEGGKFGLVKSQPEWTEWRDVPMEVET